MLPLALCEKHTNIIPESQPKKRDKEERNRKEKGSRIEDNLPEGIAMFNAGLYFLLTYYFSTNCAN